MEPGIKIVSTAFPRQDAELLKQVAKERGEDMSSIIRRQVYRFLADLGYLNEDRKKALGVIPEVAGER